MHSVSVDLAHGPYTVHIEAGALARLGELVRGVAPHARAALCGDSTVLDRFGEAARRSLEAAGYAVAVGSQEPGEDKKNLATVSDYYSVLIGGRLERQSPVVALGGGVAGDTVGFAAATYLRGVPFVQCPTTLLAMVDSSVGGKVGVNLPEGKNLVGSFHQPCLVVADLDTLLTLPDRELRCGLAECVKHAVIRDAPLFSWLEKNAGRILARELPALEELVVRNVSIKAAVVAADERESNVRAHLNFGHTFAHAIEKTSGYGAIQHGEAVSIGMVAAAELAIHLGRCERDLRERLARLLTLFGLPTASRLASVDLLMEAISLDKKVLGGIPRFILPKSIGEVEIAGGIDADAVRAAWKAVAE